MSRGEAMMSVGWRAFFMAMHIVTATGLFVLFSKNGVVDPRVFEEAVRDRHTDSLHFALQIGRLDLVALMLSMFGIFVAVAAVFGFIEVRSRAVQVAREVGEAEAIRLFENFLDQKAPGVIRAHVELLSQPDDTGDGDDIAKAYGL